MSCVHCRELLRLAREEAESGPVSLTPARLSERGIGRVLAPMALDLCVFMVTFLTFFGVTSWLLRASQSEPAVAVCIEDKQGTWCAPVEPADVARVLAESASLAGGNEERTMGKIAFGNAKGTEFAQAETGDLEWYLKVQRERLAKEPDGQYAKFQRKDIGEIEGILRARTGGGQSSAMVPAGQAHQGQIVQRGSADVRKLEGTYSKPKEVRDALNQAAALGHLVTPATGCSDLPEGCSIALSVVYVDVGTETYDVGGKAGLAKSALQKIASAAGISWDATQSGRLDNGADPHYCLWKAVGTYRTFDGRELQTVATKEMDLRDGSAQVDALYERYDTAKARYEEWMKGGRQGKDRYPPKEPTGQIREMRLHIAAHAETKAQLRAIRSIGVRSAYSSAELQRPFIVAALQFTGRTDNEVLAEKFATMRATAMLGGARALYGVAPTGAGFAPPQAQLVAAPPVRRTIDDDDAPPPSAPEPGGYDDGPPPGYYENSAPEPPPPAAPEARPTPRASADAPPPPPPQRRQTRTRPVEPPPNAGDTWVPNEEDERRAREIDRAGA